MYYFDIVHPEIQTPYKVRYISKTEKSSGFEALSYINNLQSGQLNGYKALLQTFLEAGVELFTEENFHPISRPDGLFQFIKGRHRVVCFFDDDETMVVLTHGFIKKTDPSPKDQIAKAVKLKRLYFQAKEECELNLITD